MKPTFHFLAMAGLLAMATGMGCRHKSHGEINRQQARIDSLTDLLQQLKPGLGEFMVQLKYHHDQLAEAISIKSSGRAAYEVDEMKEVTEKLIKLHINNDKLVKPFPVFFEKYLQAPLASLANAADKKDIPALQFNFEALTNNCNSCHHENGMGFMEIRTR